MWHVMETWTLEKNFEEISKANQPNAFDGDCWRLFKQYCV